MCIIHTYIQSGTFKDNTSPLAVREGIQSSPMDVGEWECLEEESPFSQIVAGNRDEKPLQNVLQNVNLVSKGDSIKDAFKRRTSLDKEDSIKRRPSYEAKEINVIVDDGEKVRILLPGAGEFNDCITKDVHPGILKSPLCSDFKLEMYQGTDFRESAFPSFPREDAFPCKAVSQIARVSNYLNPIP